MAEEEAPYAEPPLNFAEHPAPEPRPVTISSANVGKYLSKVSNVFDASGYAFVQLSAADEGIVDVSHLKTFEHLRYVDVSGNLLTHLDDVCHLKRTRILNAKGNRVKSLSCADGDAVLPYCGVMDLSENHLETVGKLNFPALKYINLRGNVIRSLGSFSGHANLEKVDLSGNSLTSLEGLANFPKLSTLNVSNNKISSVAGMSNNPALADVDLSGNKVASLAGLPTDTIHTLNLSQNNIQEVSALAQGFIGLVSLDLTENPVAEAVDDLKTEALIVLDYQLSQFNGELVSAEDAAAAKEVYDARVEAERKAEEERLAAEEAERVAAAEAAAAAEAEAAAAAEGEEAPAE